MKISRNRIFPVKCSVQRICKIACCAGMICIFFWIYCLVSTLEAEIRERFQNHSSELTFTPLQRKALKAIVAMNAAMILYYAGIGLLIMTGVVGIIRFSPEERTVSFNV